MNVVDTFGRNTTATYEDAGGRADDSNYYDDVVNCDGDADDDDYDYDGDFCDDINYKDHDKCGDYDSMCCVDYSDGSNTIGDNEVDAYNGGGDDSDYYNVDDGFAAEMKRCQYL